jgi:PAS domain S-box-containing protein
LKKSASGKAPRRAGRPAVTASQSKLAALRRQLDDALQQQAATSELLRVISSSSFDLPVILNALIQSAMHLCKADAANIWRRDGEVLRLAASCGHSEEFKTFAQLNPIKLERGTVSGRVVLDRRTIHIPDVLADRDFTGIGYQSRGNYRTHLGVPLLRNGTAIGTFALTRVDVSPFSQREVDLVEGFAAKAVIAIEIVRLLEALRESETYNKMLFQESHLPIVVLEPEVYRFVGCNREAARIFGYSSREDIIGKTSLDMSAPTQYDGSDSAVAARRRREAALTHGIESFEWRHQRPNGQIWDAMVRLMAFDYGGRRLLQASLEDITERKRTEEALRESRQLLESVLENSAAVIYAKRKDGRYTYINREWETVCGMSRGTVLGRTDHDLFPPDIARQFRSNDLGVLSSGKLSEFEERLGTPGGEQLFLSKKVPMFSADGEVEGLCGISTNITSLRQHELALRETIMTLQRERENKLMSVDAITGAIAHEVRQPLVAIASNAGAALRYSEKSPPDYEKVRSALKTIISEGHRASEVFDTVRALVRKSDQEQFLIDVNKATSEALQSMRSELREHNVTTRLELAPQLPAIWGHQSQLQEVVVNLVHNAIEAMHDTPEPERVMQVKTALRDSDSIIVAIEDNGSGIDPNMIGEIFEAFVTTKTKGMGLGLAICRKIIENHGGQLSAESDGKMGARFQFVLPVAREDTLSAQSHATP